MRVTTGRIGWMKVVLGISLAVNLAVVAAVGGAALRHRNDGSERGQGPRGGALYMKALPHDAKRELRTQLRQMRRAPRDAGAMIDALRAEPFDPAAAARVLDADQQYAQARQTAARALWLDLVSGMDRDARLEYAETLAKMAQGNRKSAKRLD